MKVIINDTLKQLLYDAFKAGQTLGYFGDDSKDLCKEIHGYSNFEEWSDSYIIEHINDED